MALERGNSIYGNYYLLAAILGCKSIAVNANGDCVENLDCVY